jgi:uncharacterized protein YjiS (DUF1127 family)
MTEEEMYAPPSGSMALRVLLRGLRERGRERDELERMHEIEKEGLGRYGRRRVNLYEIQRGGRIDILVPDSASKRGS